MSIRVSCPGCSASFKVKDEYAGKRAKCPKCGNPITIPTAPATVGPTDTVKMPPGAFPARPSRPKPAEDKDPPAGSP